MAAAAHTKQLEDKLARYERIMSDCSRCKAALAIEGGDNATSLSPPQAGSSRPIAPKSTFTVSKRSTRAPIPTTRQDQSTRSSKQAPSTSQSKPSSGSQAKPSSSSQPKTSSTSRSEPQLSNTEIVGPTSTRGPSSRSGRRASGPPTNTAGRPSSRLSKQMTADAVTSLPGSSSTQLTFTSTALDFRPTCIKPKPQVHPHKAPGWLFPADKMLGEIPTGWVWRVKIVQVDRSLLAAVATDTITMPGDAFRAVDDTQDKDRLLKLVRGFAHRHSVQRTNFQHFLLVCLCRVLSAQGFPRSSIVETLQICISDTSEGNIDRYLKGAKWANKLLNRLFFTGWGYRAIDLMVIWDRSIATYGRFGSTSDPTGDYFVSHLEQSEYFKEVEEVPNRVHSTIPWILKKDLGDEVSYETICKALGYSKEYISETQHLQSSPEPLPDADIQPSDDRASVSESRSFHSARQSVDRASSVPLNPQGVLTSGDLDGAAYLQASTTLGNQTLAKDTPRDSARRDPTANQIADPQRSKRIVPDRSAQPLGDSTGSAPATQNSKRPLPDSPTSQSQSNDPPRRRQHEEEGTSREGTGSSSRPGKKDSHKRRDRA